MTLLNSIVVVLITFVLSTIFGNRISSGWQKRNWEHQATYNRDVEDQNLRFQTMEQVSNLIAKRQFRMQRVIWALRSQKMERVCDAWRNYEITIFEWNDSLKGLNLKIRHLFPSIPRDSLEEGIAAEFTYIGGLLELAKKQLEVNRIDSEFYRLITQSSGRLNNFIFHSNNFIDELWAFVIHKRELIDGKKGYIEKLSDLSTFQLLKLAFSGVKKL